jgi:glycyl-tRNA synthetase beta chain
MADFLLEVRTEEIPANALSGVRKQLESSFRESLKQHGFDAFKVRPLSTSRRLIVVVSELPEKQADRTEEVTGPPVSVAYDQDGVLTKAGAGFAKKVGLNPDELQKKSTPKGEYLAATVIHQGQLTVEILTEIVPAVFTRLRFPKLMRWGLGEHQFVRPVHSVVALFDEKPLGLELFGVKAGQKTVGHRVHAPSPVRIESPAEYEGIIAENRVLVDPAERKKVLSDRAAELAAEVGCAVHPDEDLIAEHVELVEYPQLLRGSFDEEYLELPDEVVVTTLRYHQKCLILETKDGQLAPYFLAVVDRSDDPEGLVCQGNEWVIGARLADARFFFEEDRKRKMADLVPGLERLEFHRVLGSLAEKAKRVASLATGLASGLGLKIDAGEIERVASLVKVDLVTNMVGEFPELQGVMGGHYLRLEGEPEEAWTAARDHYRPVGFEGELPTSDLGKLIGVADRLDTVAGLFAVGEIPSGSKDPFGLRRAAQGVVKIVAESGWGFDVESALESAVEGVRIAAGSETGDVIEIANPFLRERVRRYLIDVIGVAFDTADAAMAASWNRLPDLVARGRALDSARSADEFRSLALAFKRVLNITEDYPDGDVDRELFEQTEENELLESVTTFQSTLDGLLVELRVDEAFAAMAPVADVLDRFFIEVLVMCENQNVQTNRISLLRQLRREFLRLADLSKLQVEGG